MMVRVREKTVPLSRLAQVRVSEDDSLEAAKLCKDTLSQGRGARSVRRDLKKIG